MSTQHAATPHLVVGVDVGGTFTDLFVLDERDGSARILARRPSLHPVLSLLPPLGREAPTC
jgi:N-methylhydantoinase A/oxoprolinase/acetone carboxylase beta subunit